MCGGVIMDRSKNDIRAKVHSILFKGPLGITSAERLKDVDVGCF